MDKGRIFESNEGIQVLVRNKIRRSLKEVQLSADEDEFVGSNMISSHDKASYNVKQSKTVEKVIAAEKENVSTVRRSKRKTAAEKVTYAESPLEVKPPKAKNTVTKKTVTKSKKSRSTVTKKNELKSDSNQLKLNFSPVATDTANENPCPSPSDDNLEKKLPAVSTGVDEDSGFDPTSGIGDHSPMNSTAISRTSNAKSLSAIPNISVISAETPSLNYWRELAEQRRVALEETLHENELLHDQLEVLEAENAQLKELLKEAENLAEVVRAIVQ